MAKIGDLRRSAVVMTYGPGAIIDFKVGAAPVSVIASGIDEWDRRVPPEGIKNPQSIFEPRLQKRLNVKGFRLPPVVDDDASSETLVGVRFPQWLQCPRCGTLQAANRWNGDPGRPEKRCGSCTSAAPGGRPVYVVPVRFVVACERGHIDDFPWHLWVGHKESCAHRNELTLKTTGPGLAGLRLSCPKCGAFKSMEGIFQRSSLSHVGCRGKRPWLRGADEICDQSVLAVQRGASNIYFPDLHSALDIPPWSDRIQKLLGQYWDPICQVDKSQREQFITILSGVIGDTGMSAAELSALVDLRLKLLENVTAESIRWDEYLQLLVPSATAVDGSSEFEVRSEVVPEKLKGHLDCVTRVVRLREVRALSGFTRISPPSFADENGKVQIAAIQSTPKDWLPAVEVRGEGIFARLNLEAVRLWESQQTVRQRAAHLNDLFRTEWQARSGTDESPPKVISPRFVLVHTFAHLLMRRLALECGYSTASLRERLYVSSEPNEMAGVLIYTATSDADGTLGGLVRQGLAKRFESLVQGALLDAQWCSSDPLCIDGAMSLAGALNGSACHACALAPETSCEEFNQFLDRAYVVGLPSDSNVGFFSSLLTI